MLDSGFALLKINKEEKVMRLIELLIVVAIMALIAVVVYGTAIENRAAYAAWVKHTKNPTELTYGEWRVLMQVTRHNNTTMIPYPITVGRW